MSTRTAVLLAVVLLGSALSACGGGDRARDPAGDASSATGALHGDYVVTAGLPALFTATDRVSVSFSDGAVSFSGTCNHFSGDATWDGSTLRVDHLGGTEMGCADRSQRQDDWLVALLSGAPTVVGRGDGATLSQGATTLRLGRRDAVEPAVDLVGPDWVLTSIGSGGADGTASSVPVGVRASLRFLPGDAVTVDTGCNSGSGDVVVEGDRLRITHLLTTLRACTPPEGTVEGAVLGVLRGPATWHLEGRQLTLAGADTVLTWAAR